MRKQAADANDYQRVDEFERELLQEALDRARAKELEAARALGQSVTAFQLKAERLGVSRESRRTVGIPKVQF